MPANWTSGVQCRLYCTLYLNIALFGKKKSIAVQQKKMNLLMKNEVIIYQVRIIYTKI